jgi:hypothetical protein
VRAHSTNAAEWMVHVEADAPILDASDEGVLETFREHLKHASASVGMSSGRLDVTLTVQASCHADAARMGEWVVRTALAASGLGASSVIRAEVEFAEE